MLIIPPEEIVKPCKTLVEFCKDTLSNDQRNWVGLTR